MNKILRQKKRKAFFIIQYFLHNISYMYLDFWRKKKRIHHGNKVLILFVINKKQKSNLMGKNKLKYIKIAIIL